MDTDEIHERLVDWQIRVSLGVPPRAKDDPKELLCKLGHAEFFTLEAGTECAPKYELARLVWLESAKRRGEIADWSWRFVRGRVVVQAAPRRDDGASQRDRS